MLLTKEQYAKKKGIPEIKAKLWYGIDFVRVELCKNYDIYIDENMIYVFPLKRCE